MLNFLFESRRLVVAATAGVLMASTAVAAIDLKLERRASEAGKAKVCVTMDSKGTDIAGTQNDIVFDSTCASLVKTDCVASAHHGKPLHGSIPANEPSTFRSLVFALDNVDPMADGEVYCCTFTLEGSGDGCCAVGMARLGASDPQGVAIDANAAPGRVCLVGDGAAPAAAAPAQQAATTDATDSSPSWLWIVILAAVVIAVLFFVLRKAG